MALKKYLISLTINYKRLNVETNLIRNFVEEVYFFKNNNNEKTKW